MLALEGNPIEAIPLIEEAISRSETLGVHPYDGWDAGFLADACLRAGRDADALVHGQQALALARARAERPNEALALHILGEIATKCTEDERAADYYARALDLATELGMRPVIAHCHAGLAKLDERAGRREQAREHLPRPCIKRWGMPVWLQQAEVGINPRQ